MSDIDTEHQFKGDPFFEIIHDGEWNATLGRQGHEENYLDGYIEAAIELADAIVEKKLYEKRDTLILPILYNARHATELNIKFAYEKLISAGAIRDDGHGLDHNISAYWQHLRDSNVGDIKLRHIVAALEVFVRSLARIDADGQELRYHRNRDNDLSLEKFSIVNLSLVQKSLRELHALLSDLKYRTLDFVDERATGTFTAACSRRDLNAIARALLPRDRWTDAAFDEVKTAIRQRFGLSSNELSKACKEIQRTRELAALIGIETPLLYLTDDDVMWVIGQWRSLHPKRSQDDTDIEFDYFDISRLEEMQERGRLYQEVINAVNQRLDSGKLADFEVMFYRERDRIPSEYYDRMVAAKLEEHAAAKDSKAEIRHLLEKTNLLQNVRGSAMRLGRVALAAALQDI
ncbi:hypothetical protein EN852_014740 [Mesorhizobium sp. M2E.F.Ca.ET.209.01.1.1]|uniref:hypothetical protein n=1 Tax=Mesorhizobium sp. M2E.F.Ca.ET.209.01.1.1 TaxID=2500526 RepID=UPI000FD94AEC|nr:hypothetical protein [Mesorhizobium sp. M2E.F.Ca.ET.209.01.1.1]TGS14455.1 hypothetical protein EN852_014740 [Mesorhizobium sp. M2E.F.Ca.ET.209.01.1.1]